MSGMYQPGNDPDPVWRMGRPLPDPGPALTAEQEEDLAAYDDYVHSMQGRDIDQRAESDPNWTAPTWPSLRWPWEAERPAESEAEAGQ
jgi:hypothetical protein